MSTINNKLTIEDIILQQGRRGMDLLRPYLPADFCQQAANRICDLPRGTVILTTGFYVAGAAETDGPPGTAVLALALEKLGFHCLIVTDGLCRNLFEPLNLEVRYLDHSFTAYAELLDDVNPVGLISIERCGRNSKGFFGNSRGESINAVTPPLDELFLLAKERGIYTIGVGDGGNEIGMGNVQEAISQHLALLPCAVCVDDLVIATVSNWGAYGLAAALSACTRRDLLPTAAWLQDYMYQLAAAGCTDGIDRVPAPTADGFPLGTEWAVYQQTIDWAAGK